VLGLRDAIEQITDGHAALYGRDSAHDVLQASADLATRALGAISCVASFAGSTAGATGSTNAVSGTGTTQTDAAHVIVSTAPCGSSHLALTVTLDHAAGEGQAALLGLIAAMAAGALSGLSPA
jgi:hypothetical protein